MKTPIIRKPKFMRSDIAMKAYIDTADAIGKTLADPSLTQEQQYELLKKIGECINKAAKAGGFLSTEDFIKWMDMKEHELKKKGL